MEARTQFPKTKVLLVSAAIPPIYAGAGIQWYRYARRLNSRSELAYLMCLRLQQDPCLNFRPEVPENRIVRIDPCRGGSENTIGSPIRKAFLRCKLFVLVGLQMIRSCRGYNVVHVTSGSPLCVFAILWGLLLRKTTVFETTLPGCDDFVSIRRGSRFSHAVLKSAHACLAISPQLHSLCVQGGARPERTHLIANPRDTDIFIPIDIESKVRLRQRLGIPANGKVVVFVGGLLKRKGADLLAPIYLELARKDPRVVLLLVGPECPANDLCAVDPSVSSSIREGLKDQILAGSVILTGNVYNVHEFVQASDIFLFPSRNEGLPNAPIEAMSCGLPCVVRDIPGVTEAYIKDQVDGIIVSGDAIDSYVDALLQLLNDTVKYSTMAKKARETVVSRWAASLADKRYMEIYNEPR